MITIREMQIDDLEQVMPIEEANFSIPWTETGFFTFLIRDDALFLVAEEDGEILGYLGILISFDESEITNVCVAEKARRRGIGHALMEELFRRMQERKVRVIHLDVRIGNTPARNRTRADGGTVPSDAGEKGARDSSGCAHRQYAGTESV